jgi:hypothetical protein
MTIIQPYQSAYVDIGVDDWMIVDGDYTTPQTFNPAYRQVNLQPLEIYNSSMVYQGIIDNYTYFTYTANWFDVDKWEFQVSRYATGVSTIALGGFVRYTHNGTSRIGIIERLERPLGPDGKASEKWLVSGHGVESILSSRLATYATDSGTGYHTIADSATVAMQTIVDKNCITTDANRIVTGLTLDPAPAADVTSVKISARFQVLTDLLYEICTQTGLSYYLAWSGSGLNFVFTIRKGTNRTTTVKISPDFDNVKSFNYLLTNAELRNLAYVGGVGTANSRDVDAVYVSSEPAGWSRREVFVEASDCLDTTTMLSRGTSTLATMGVQTVLEAVYNESNTFKYGTDFFLGDTIAVVFPGIISTTGQIVSATDKYDSNGVLTTLTIGRVYPTLIGIMKDYIKQVSAQVRR